MTNSRTLHHMVNELVYRQDELDEFLDHQQPNWGYFDPELGYTSRNRIWTEGADGPFVRNTYIPNGPRTRVNHPCAPCRINTYGDSFTDSAQVNDGETWQEMLAARLGEPVQNFGVGGYGCYQAYRRMLRIEQTDFKAQYLILNIYNSDDHYRNIDAFRWVRWHGNVKRTLGVKFRMVHANPACYLQYNPASGDFEEIANPCPSAESLYLLTDHDYVFHLLENDFATQIMLAQSGYTVHNMALLRAIAESLQLPLTFDDAHDCRDAAAALHWAVALRSTMHVVELWQRFCAQQARRCLIATCYGADMLFACIAGAARSDQPVLDFLQANAIPYFDSGAAHQQDFTLFRGDRDAYYRRLYRAGHYNPLGNFFFADSIKDELLKILQPLPVLYDEEQARDAAKQLNCGRNFGL